MDWRQEWEHKLVVNETKLLRGLAELNAAFQHRAGLTESFFRDQIKLQHADFEGALDRYGVDIQKRLWADLERIRKDYDHLIHSELRLIRQRAAMSSSLSSRRHRAASPPPQPHPPRRSRNSTTPVSPSASAVRKTTSRKASSSTCRISPGGARCWISAAGAASFWN